MTLATRRKAIGLVLLVLVLVLPVRAQDDDCGNGLPCGRLPWDLPQLPALASPTPMPTVIITAAPATATPGGSANPGATATSSAAAGEAGELIDQSAPVVEATPEIVLGLDGAAVDLSQVEASAEFGLAFGYVRGISGLTFGVFTPLITFVFVWLVYSLARAAATYLLSLAGVLVGMIRKIIHLIGEFIPF